ncbi:MAG: hydroxyacid dehydrogenase, partial [Helicobacter sp.]|nr:hydroxyacid dehydrogenase [Helicobacter sp.]
MQNKIVFLDALSLGESNIQSQLETFGSYTAYPTTKPEETLQRSKGANIILSNKVVLSRDILEALKKDLTIICISATGTNNGDLEAAKEFGMAGT